MVLSLVTKEECMRAVRFKATDYGKLEKTGFQTWEIKNKEGIKCKWMQREKVTFIEFKITTFTGRIIDLEHEIRQTITNTKCKFQDFHCRPVEKRRSVLVW